MQGSEESLLIRTDDNLMECIETEVRGSTLYIDIRRGYNLNPTGAIETANLAAQNLDCRECLAAPPFFRCRTASSEHDCRANKKTQVVPVPIVVYFIHVYVV